MADTIMRKMSCENGHTWDAFGEMYVLGTEQIFMLDDMNQVRCPSCLQTAVDLNGSEPENLT